jgi:hypothetical protein
VYVPLNLIEVPLPADFPNGVFDNGKIPECVLSEVRDVAARQLSATIGQLLLESAIEVERKKQQKSSDRLRRLEKIADEEIF